MVVSNDSSDTQMR